MADSCARESLPLNCVKGALDSYTFSNPSAHAAAGKLCHISAVLLTLLAETARAQNSAPAGGFVIGGKPTATVSEHCVDVEIGGSRSYNCLNNELKRQVNRTSPSIITAPIGATSPDIQIGVVNVPAIQQQYGKNFGRSVVPFRPPPPIFTSPLVPNR